MISRLNSFGNVPFRISALGMVYPEHKAITAKARRLEGIGQIMRLKKGLYVVSPEISNKRLDEFLIANHIYGPSYVSLQSALRYYGLIPERVTAITSMTTLHAKTYINSIASFSYIHCPADYFGIGIKEEINGDVNFLIASPEKAICDLMIYTPNLNLRYMAEFHRYLEEDMRMDTEAVCRMDIELLRRIMEVGKKKNMISLLIKYIENERNV